MASKKKGRKDFTSQLENDFKRVRSCENQKTKRKSVRQNLTRRVKDGDFSDYD